MLPSPLLPRLPTILSIQQLVGLDIESLGQLSYRAVLGRPSEGGRALMRLKRLKNARGKDQLMWCLHCHPEYRLMGAVWSCLERRAAGGATFFTLGP